MSSITWLSVGKIVRVLLMNRDLLLHCFFEEELESSGVEIDWNLLVIGRVSVAQTKCLSSCAIHREAVGVLPILSGLEFVS